MSVGATAVDITVFFLKECLVQAVVVDVISYRPPLIHEKRPYHLFVGVCPLSHWDSVLSSSSVALGLVIQYIRS